MSFPKLDPSVKYVGASRLRQLTAQKLSSMEGAIVIQAHDATPLAVILPFQTYQNIQERMEKLTEALDRTAPAFN